MHFSTFIKGAALSLYVSSTAAVPLEASSEPRSARGTSGVYDPASGKRGSPPKECSGITNDRATSYWWLVVDSDKPTCISGYQPAASCPGTKFWGQESINEMQDAVSQQVTKDGQFKSTTTDHFLAAWHLGTSAVSDREAYKAAWSAAIKELGDCSKASVTCNRRDTTYFLQVDNDSMEFVTRAGPLWNPNEYCPDE
ncbi:hypothetical protein SCUP234_10940 [Seiridium cupressi]